MREAIWGADARPIEKLVLLYLAEWGGSGPVSLTRIARDTGLARVSVARILKRLKDRGYVEWENSPQGNRYRIILPPGAPPGPEDETLARIRRGEVPGPEELAALLKRDGVPLEDGRATFVGFSASGDRVLGRLGDELVAVDLRLVLARLRGDAQRWG